ncbi:hypothetical protein [Clavibacter zhangzhiyongii]|uniref:Lipoprotein n=1 Tax=Clavibacter zhangzhiyongii TaxID=2768071 RepID=A0A7L7Z1K4_9MICO|nr:hypothetical protein [Clavibacter zhangzhiyongii]QOD43604.1 hypothetical protein H9X71_13630 [Clavibacter zhangzhiyongii]
MPRSPRPSRVVGLVAVALLAAAPLSSCSAAAFACSDVGYRNTLDVRVVGSEEAVARVALVRMCDEDGCSGTLEQSGPSADPEAALPEHTATATGPGRWTVERGMTTPAEATFTALAADGTVKTAGTVDLALAG